MSDNNLLQTHVGLKRIEFPYAQWCIYNCAKQGKCPANIYFILSLKKMSL